MFDTLVGMFGQGGVELLILLTALLLGAGALAICRNHCRACRCSEGKVRGG
jgi:hypothetical protein